MNEALSDQMSNTWPITATAGGEAS